MKNTILRYSRVYGDAFCDRRCMIGIYTYPPPGGQICLPGTTLPQVLNANIHIHMSTHTSHT
jgi:hypothetical protein